MALFSDKASDFEYSIADGKVTIKNYIGNNSCVKIPSRIKGYPVKTIGCAFTERYNVKKVIVPRGVSHIAGSFFNCYGLEELILPSTLTHMSGMCFYRCRNLTKLHLPAKIISIVTGVFEQCYIEEMNLPDKIQDIDELPYHVRKKLNITEPLIRNGNLLLVPKDIQNYDIPHGVKKICIEAFAECSRLKKVTIPDTVTVILNGAFRDCSSLESIDIPDSVKEIGQSAFSGCKSLKSVRLPSDLTCIHAHTFCQCASLQSIDIPMSVKEIGVSAFHDCVKLEKVTVADDVETGGLAFRNTPVYKELYTKESRDKLII